MLDLRKQLDVLVDSALVKDVLNRTLAVPMTWSNRSIGMIVLNC